jgi:outer membrane protein TolC
MRWKKKLGALAMLLASVAGCKQAYFITESERDHYRNILPHELEESGKTVLEPVIDPIGTPATVTSPERDIRYISLAECISIALEQGTVGNLQLPPGIAGIGPSPAAPAIDTLTSFTGQGVGGFGTGDNIKVLQLDPGIVGAGVEASLAKFDAVWTNSASWTTTDRPVGTALDNFQTGNSGVGVIKQQDAAVSTGILKPLPTGGVAGITFTTDYTLTNLPARVNPSYRPTLQFQFEQPLLQGYGVEINQIRASHPGSVLTPGALQGQTSAEGILITRIRTDQQRAEFERNVQIMLANVEFTYWSLYAAYWNLYARESGLRMAYDSWRVFKAQLEAGRVAQADEAQARGQFDLFRSQRLDALQNVLEAEHQLRRMLGMHVEDGKRLVPTDQPTLAPFEPNWDTSLHEAYQLRPELYMVRQELKVDQMNLIAAKNQLLPDLRFTATYDFNDIGSRLDGAGPLDAFGNLAKGEHSNWAVGLRANIPIGYRAQEANVRIAKLRLARTYAVLKDQEYKLESSMSTQYGRLQYAYEQIKAFRAQRIAYGDQLRGLVELVLRGAKTPNVLLEAQRFYADALAGEYNAIRDYNNAIAAFEYSKGTIMQHDNVRISEGCLPACAYKRAVEHQRERNKAIEIRERATPVDCDVPGQSYDPLPPAKVPTDGPAPTLPSLMMGTEKLPPLDGKSVFDANTKVGDKAKKPADVSTLNGLVGPAKQVKPPALLPDVKGTPSKAATTPTTIIPAVKNPTDFGVSRPSDSLPTATPLADTPKPPSRLPPAPMPLDGTSTKIE